MPMHSWMSPKIELRSGGISGSGIFAKEAILKDERLVVFGGKVMTISEEQELPDAIADYAHQIDVDLVIGIYREEDIQPVDHLNHSCEPNAGFKGQIMLVAMREISPGEEITFDYAMTLSEAEGDDYEEGIPCLCERSGCRKLIRDSDWRIPELQQRYAGYFQLYLSDKIARL